MGFPIDLPPSPEPLMDVVAAFVSIRGSPPIGVAVACLPPSAQEAVLGPTIHQLEAAGVSVILADFNARHPAWCPALHTRYQPHVNKSAIHRGLELAGLGGWVVANSRVHTRPSSKSSPDTILFRSPQVGGIFSLHPVWSREPALTLQASDHLPLLFEALDPEEDQCWRPSRCRLIAYDKIDWEELRRTWRIPHVPVHRPAMVHFSVYWSALQRVLRRLPQRSRTVRPSPPRRPDSLRQLEDDICNALPPAGGSFPPTLRAKIIEYREQLGTWRAQLEESRLDGLHKSSPALWRLLKPSRSIHPLLPGVLPRGTANVFAKGFADKHKRSGCSQASLPPCQTLSPVIVTVGEVSAAIRRLNPRQSGDPHGLRPQFFRELSQGVGKSLAMMFTAMLRDGFFPTLWRRTDVVPVYKGGDKPTDSVGSFRPVAVGDLRCRLLESIVAARLELRLRSSPLNPRGSSPAGKENGKGPHYTITR